MIRNGQRSHVHLQKEGKMAYEIDFVGVGDECKKDADAIALRWKDLFGNYKISLLKSRNRSWQKRNRHFRKLQ